MDLPSLPRMQLRHCILSASKTVRVLEVLLGMGEIPCLCCFTSASPKLWTLQFREWLLGSVSYH